MRELQLTDCETGVATTFHDVEELASACKFNDCSHDGEPGCAVQEAVDSGELDPRRLTSYLKLQREQARNAASVPERHAQSRKQGKLHKTILKASRFQKGGSVNDFR
jgi:ribosome biogenesis GTPase